MDKTKQTLYNFVSLRSPESTKTHEKDFRFIEIPGSTIRIAKLPKCKNDETESKDGKKYNPDSNQGECSLRDQLIELINTDSGIILTKSSVADKCHKQTEKEKELLTFTGRAKFIAENKSEIDYNYLLDLENRNFRNIRNEVVRLLFSELIQLVNESKDFQLKELICEWLIFWNLLNRICDLKTQVEAEKAKKEAEDKKNNRYSFCGAESQKEFRNAAAKPYIQQLLSATIILPTPEQLKDKDKDKDKNEHSAIIRKLSIIEKGPIKTSGTQNYLQSKPAFVLSEALNRKHAINLANFQLEKTANLSDDERQKLRITILENTSFSQTRTFFAGIAVNTDPSESSLGVKASILVKSDTYCLIITSNDKSVPYKATIWTKKTRSNTFENPYGKEFSKITQSSDGWFIELGKVSDPDPTLIFNPDLNPDTDNLFVELKYVSDGISLTSFQMVSTTGLDPIKFQGSGETSYSQGFKFTADLSRPHERHLDDTKLHDDKDNSKETKHLDCTLVLKEGIAELINEKTDNSGHIIGIPEEMTVDLFDANGPQIRNFLRDDIHYDPIAKTLTLTLKDFPENLNKTGDFGIHIFMRFADGKTYYSLPFKIRWKSESQTGDSFFIMDSGYDAYGKTFAPKGFGVKQLGVADYQRVTSHVIRYEAGEVAHIENLMGREYKEKVVTKEHVTEITEFDSLETETEKLNDATSAERFQMQTEIAKMQHEENQTKIDANVTYNGGTTTASLNYGNNTATSREESNKQAINTGKELTKRAMERIVSKIKKETTSKVTDRLTDVSKHGFDNRGSSDHVSGVYRYINAIYKNEIDNYGKRLAYEFMIPQPSKLHNLGIEATTQTDNLEIVKKPIDPRTLILDKSTKSEKSFIWNYLEENNYLTIAGEYDAEVTNYPAKEKTKIITFNERTDKASKEVEIDDGYFASDCEFTFGYNRTDPGFTGSPGEQYINVKISGVTYPNPLYTDSASAYIGGKMKLTPPITQNLKFEFTSQHTLVTELELRLSLKFNISDDIEISKWQKEVYKQIISAYDERLKEYNQKVDAIKQDAKEKFETNPLNFRQIEQTILRMNCISYLIAPYGEFPNRNFGKDLYTDPQDPKNHFASTRVKNTDQLEEYAAFVKFIEQAFEWNIMSYNFYPFYWGSYNDWHYLYQNDINDALFKSFMQAGMARVVVTVRPGFEYAVLLYMITGKIWEGGYIPVYGDDLYVSMANELKEPEYKVDGSWETVLPTNLLALQKGGAVINTHGLPNLEKPVVEGDDDGINDKGSSLNPFISNNEKVLETQKRSWWSRLLGN